MSETDVVTKTISDNRFIDELTEYIDEYGIKAVMELVLMAIDKSRRED